RHGSGICANRIALSSLEDCGSVRRRSERKQNCQNCDEKLLWLSHGANSFWQLLASPKRKRRNRSRVTLTSLDVAPNSLSFDRQDRREVWSIGQHDSLKNRANLFSVVNEHTRGRRGAHQVSGAVVNVCDQA